MSRGHELQQMSSAHSNAGGRRGTNRRLVKDAVRYKTMLCTNWSADGKCPYGPKCQFAHGPQELRARSDAKGEQSRATSPAPEPSAAAPSSSAAATEICLSCRPPAAGLPWTAVVAQPATRAYTATTPTSPTAASMPLPAALPQALPQADALKAPQPLPSLLPLSGRSLNSALPAFAGFPAEAASTHPKHPSPPVPPMSLQLPPAQGLPASTPLLSAVQVRASPLYPASTASSPVHAAGPSPAPLPMYPASTASSAILSAAPSPPLSLCIGGLMPPGLAPPSMSPRSSELSQPPQTQLSWQPQGQQPQVPQQPVHHQQVKQQQVPQQQQQELYDCAFYDALCDSRRRSWESIGLSDDSDRSDRFDSYDSYGSLPADDGYDSLIRCNTRTGSVEVLVPVGRQVSHSTECVRRQMSMLFNEP